MKKLFATLVVVVVLLCGCTTTRQFFGVLGGGAAGGVAGYSALGLVGGVTGLVIGSSVGALFTTHEPKGDQQSRKDQKVDEYNRRFSPEQRKTTKYWRSDVLAEYFDEVSQSVVMDSVCLTDENGNGAIDGDEHCKIEFELFNCSLETLLNIVPALTVSGTKGVVVLPMDIVPSLAPAKGVHYAAEIYGKPNLRKGTAVFSLGFARGNAVYTVRTFQFATCKKRRTK